MKHTYIYVCVILDIHKHKKINAVTALWCENSSCYSLKHCLLSDSILHHAFTVFNLMLKFIYSLLISHTALLPQVTANGSLAKESAAFSLKQPTEYSTMLKHKVFEVHVFLLSYIFWHCLELFHSSRTLKHSQADSSNPSTAWTRLEYTELITSSY